MGSSGGGARNEKGKIFSNARNHHRLLDASTIKRNCKEPNYQVRLTSLNYENRYPQTVISPLMKAVTQHKSDTLLSVEHETQILGKRL